MSDEQFEAVKIAARTVGNTNCAWWEHEVSKMVRMWFHIEDERRAANRERSDASQQ